MQLSATMVDVGYGHVATATKPIKVVDMLRLVPSDPVTISPASLFQYFLTRNNDQNATVSTSH